MPVFAPTSEDTGMSTCPCHPDIFHALRELRSRMMTRNIANCRTQPNRLRIVDLPRHPIRVYIRTETSQLHFLTSKLYLLHTQFKIPTAKSTPV